MHPELPKMIKYAKDVGAAKHISFHTNGHKLTSKKSRELIDSGLDEIIVSLNAASEETYSKVTGNSNYKKVVQNIQEFMELKRGKNCQN